MSDTLPKHDLLDKWSRVHDDAVTITTFMEWYQNLPEEQKQFKSIDILIYEYFDIDFKELEKQRRELLESVRSK